VLLGWECGRPARSGVLLGWECGRPARSGAPGLGVRASRPQGQQAGSAGVVPAAALLGWERGRPARSGVLLGWERGRRARRGRLGAQASRPHRS